jgi:hypothetical protein
MRHETSDESFIPLGSFEYVISSHILILFKNSFWCFHTSQVMRVGSMKPVTVVSWDDDCDTGGEGIPELN